MSISARRKIDIVADWAEGKVSAVESGVNTETRHRRQTEPLVSRKDRSEVMGNPVFFLEVRNEGPTTKTVSKNAGGMLQNEHTLRVALFYEYEDATNYKDSSRSAFDAIVHSTSDGQPGLHYATAVSRVIASSGDRVVLKDPENDVDDVVPLDNSGKEAAHIFTYNVAVEG